MEFLTLDVKGLFVALLLAAGLFFGGSANSNIFMGLFFVGAMVYFLVFSALVTNLGKKRKKQIKLFQKARGAYNVLGNGVGPLIFAILYYVAAASGPSAVKIAIIGFLGSVAAITSDKFSSEIGVLNGAPISIVTLKKVKKGESGGITLLGSEAGFLGAFVVAVFAELLLPAGITGSTLALVLSVSVGGFIGMLLDSVFGVLEEKGFGNKHTSNFACSIVGGVAAVLLSQALLFL